MFTSAVSLYARLLYDLFHAVKHVTFTAFARMLHLAITAKCS
jgi:hypothetical protein